MYIANDRLSCVESESLHWQLSIIIRINLIGLVPNQSDLDLT